MDYLCTGVPCCKALEGLTELEGTAEKGELWQNSRKIAFASDLTGQMRSCHNPSDHDEFYSTILSRLRCFLVVYVSTGTYQSPNDPT